jgi:hypothetical protein
MIRLKNKERKMDKVKVIFCGVEEISPPPHEDPIIYRVLV